MASDEQRPEPAGSSTVSFFSNILTPGSSLHPTFLLVLDLVFLALLCVLLSLVFATAGNIHFVVLTVIELGLWASVKWFVYELKNTPSSEAQESKKSS